MIGTPLAFVFGIVTLKRISKSGGRISGRGQAIAGLVTGTLSLLVYAAMILPAIAGAREKDRRAECLSNMKQLGLAIGEYAAAHNGETPVRLEELKPYVHGDWEKISRCPSARDNSAPSYEIVGAGIDNPDAVVLRENPANHRGTGGHVLYGDGHVSWVSADARAPGY
jgi:prepilin-type processing-associated H-X9-DG protein